MPSIHSRTVSRSIPGMTALTRSPGKTYLFTALSVLPLLVLDPDVGPLLGTDPLGLFETGSDGPRGDLGVLVVAVRSPRWNGIQGKQGQLACSSRVFCRPGGSVGFLGSPEEGPPSRHDE